MLFYAFPFTIFSAGLLIGTICAWMFVAPKLRRYSIAAGDAITIPQFLTKRFLTKSPILQIICAVIFIVAYCVYAASSLVACGNLFTTVFGVREVGGITLNATFYMICEAVIILLYTFLGGFNAVCWTDFFQGMLMLAALMATPLIVNFAVQASDFAPLAQVSTDPNYYNLLSSGKLDWKRFTYAGAIAGIVTGFAVDALWYVFLSSSTGLYEIIPGFIASMIAAILVSKWDKEPSKEIEELFDKAKQEV